MVAPRDHLRRQLTTLRPQDIGGLLGVMETRQFDRVLQQFDADQLAAFRQQQRLGIRERVKRHVVRRIRRVRRCAIAAVIGGPNGESETGVESVSGAEQIADIHLLRDPFDPDPEKSSHRKASLPSRAGSRDMPFGFVKAALMC